MCCKGWGLARREYYFDNYIHSLCERKIYILIVNNCNDFVKNPKVFKKNAVIQHVKQKCNTRGNKLPKN